VLRGLRGRSAPVEASSRPRAARWLTAGIATRTIRLRCGRPSATATADGVDLSTQAGSISATSRHQGELGGADCSSAGAGVVSLTESDLVWPPAPAATSSMRLPSVIPGRRGNRSTAQSVSVRLLVGECHQNCPSSGHHPQSAGPRGRSHGHTVVGLCTLECPGNA
jgi:hypothetical protein